jgi:hypothetical protein
MRLEKKDTARGYLEWEAPVSAAAAAGRGDELGSLIDQQR